MQNILNSDNIIELHHKLDEFAIHHQKKGVEQAIFLIDKEIAKRSKMNSSADSKCVLKDQAIDETLLKCKDLLSSIL